MSRSRILSLPQINTFGRITLMFIVTVVVACAMVWLSPGQIRNATPVNSPEIQVQSNNPASKANSEPDPLEQNSLASLQSLSDQEIQDLQRSANEAAVLPTAFQAITTPLIKRPDFVSPFEWIVLTQIADGQADSDKYLVKLVKSLRFNKQYDWWQQQKETAPPASVKQVAQRLLTDIPERITSGDLDQSRAQQLQFAIISDLVSDEQQRQVLLAHEAKRIGVTFEVKSY